MSGCLEWTGPRLKGGYGQVTVKGKRWLAHRLTWHVFNGPIPQGMFVCHHLRQPSLR